MTDIAVDFDNDLGIGEFVIANGDLAAADIDLVSSILLMLFSDAVSGDDFTPADGDRRGWWGSTYEPFPIGSRLWELDRAKFAANTSPLLMARDYTREAMQPFIDQGMASKVNVDVTKIGQHALLVKITMFRPHQPYPLTFQFGYAWNQVNR